MLCNTPGERQARWRRCSRRQLIYHIEPRLRAVSVAAHDEAATAEASDFRRLAAGHAPRYRAAPQKSVVESFVYFAEVAAPEALMAAKQIASQRFAPMILQRLRQPRLQRWCFSVSHFSLPPERCARPPPVAHYARPPMRQISLHAWYSRAALTHVQMQATFSFTRTAEAYAFDAA